MMTKTEFLTRLKESLMKLPPEESESALRYYTEYFDEAGEENQQRVLQELGDPQKLAQSILAESMVRDIVSPPAKLDAPTVPKTPLGRYSTVSGGSSAADESSQPQKKPPKRGLGAVWTVIAAIFVAPIALPFAIAISVVAFALVVAAAAVVFAFFAVSIALMAGGAFAFMLGFTLLGVHPPTGFCAIGAGLIIAGIGLLLFLPMIWLAQAMFTGIARLIGRYVFPKKEGHS